MVYFNFQKKNPMRYITLFITLLLFSACQNNVEKEKDSKQKTRETKDTVIQNNAQKEIPTLQNMLDERKANFNQKASEEKKIIYAEGIAAIENSSIFEE